MQWMYSVQLYRKGVSHLKMLFAPRQAAYKWSGSKYKALSKDGALYFGGEKAAGRMIQGKTRRERRFAGSNATDDALKTQLYVVKRTIRFVQEANGQKGCVLRFTNGFRAAVIRREAAV